MKAAVFEGNGRLVVKEVPDPKIEDKVVPKKYKEETLKIRKEEQVLLKVLAASICGTDIHILNVPPGHPATLGVILGHEYVGEVLEIGDEVKNVEIGDRVVVDPNIKCGVCWYCRNGFPNMCRDMTTLGIFCDGGFAEYNIAPAKQLFSIPSDMDVEKAIFFEPLSCAVHDWEKVNLKVGESILIFGAGPIGCCFIELARVCGANTIIVSEPNPFRRKFAQELGAIVVDPMNEDLSRIIYELTGHGVDVAIDACGVPEVINQAIDYVRPGGRISTFGQQNINAFADKVSFTKVTNKELTIFGSYIASRSFDQTIEFLKRNDVNLGKLITHRITLDEINKGIDLMRKGEAMKIVVYPFKG